MAMQHDRLILKPLEKSNVQPKFQRAEHGKQEVCKIKPLLLSKISKYKNNGSIFQNKYPQAKQRYLA